ncbi:MAG TPA: hypothetical protein P5572_12030 [Phycisphaerae bacterium]|nr:hypothetical protein [Phycisphaerae bacterium]
MRTDPYRFAAMLRTPTPPTYRRHMAFQLATLIAAQRQFQTLAELCSFCANPENLRTWLPSQDDRVNLAAELASTLPHLPAA